MRHPACKRSARVPDRSADLTIIGGAPDRWEASYDPGVPRHLTYPEIPLHDRVPVAVALRDELPKTIVGKVLRRKLVVEDPGVTLSALPRAG